MATYTVDPTHASIEFSARHLGISAVKGSFQQFTGNLELDEADPARSRGVVAVDLASLTTGNDKRDEHLKSADFFHVENHPQAKFTTRSITPTGEDRYRVVGELTVRGVTRPVELEAELTGPLTDPWGNTRVGVSVRGTIDRKEWGLNWNQVLEAGRLLVGDKIKLTGEAELVRQATEAVV
jgi:polyisoprenoid-binding protein YceI